MNVDRKKIRNGILLEAVQRLPVIIPFGVGVLAASWSMAIKASALSLLLAVSGLCISTLAILHSLLFEGESIRERVIAKYQASMDAQNEKSFRDALESMAYIKKDKKAYQICQAYHEQYVKTMTTLSEATKARRLLFEDHVEQTNQDVRELVLAYDKMPHNEKSDAIGFVSEAQKVLAAIQTECSGAGTETRDTPSVEAAEGRLEELRHRVDAAHRAMERIYTAQSTEKKLDA